MVADDRTIKAKGGTKGDRGMALASAPIKDDRIDVRLPREIKRKLQQAAELEGIPLSSFLIQSAVERADDVLLRNIRIIELAESDQSRFVEWLLDPPEPTEELIQALRHHEREIDSR